MRQRTKWHEILGTQLKLLLTPLNIIVHTNLDVMSGSPKADVLILRANSKQWTPRQIACLPDGVRDTQATHVLIEFKFTESLTKLHLRKIQGYQAFYQQSQSLSDEQVQSIILTAKTPHSNFRNRYQYQPTEQAGVYHSQNVLLDDIPLITLNELADTPHNAYVKCFASRATERRKAFTQLAKLGLGEVSNSLWFFLLGLRHTMGVEGDKKEMGDKTEMLVDITPEYIAQLGEEIGTKWLNKWMLELPAEERLRGLDPQERLQGLDPQERLRGLDPQERLRGLDPQERLQGLDPQERLRGLDPQERLEGLQPEEVLLRYKPMETYVTEQKRGLLIEGLARSLRIRFKVDEAGWTGYQQRLQPLDFATLEQLSEVVLLVSDEAAFEQALSEIEAIESK